MRFSLLVLTSVLSINMAFAQNETRVEEASQSPAISSQETIVIAEDKPADASPEDQAVQAEPQPEVGAVTQPVAAQQVEVKSNRAPAVTPRSLDEIEAQANKLAKESKKQEEKSKKFQEQSAKLSNKSNKLDDKSGKLALESKHLADQSKSLADESKELASEIDQSEDKAHRDEAIKQMCLKKISRSNLLKILDRKSAEEKMTDCIADYKQGDLKEKTEIKKEYIGKQCTFNPGVSIECPEGSYKFIGSNGLDIISDAERSDKKDVQEAVGEKVEGQPAAVAVSK